MRSLIRKIIKEEFFKEDAKRMGMLPESTALFVAEVSSGYELILFDPNSDNVYGTIMIVLHESEAPYYYVRGVAAIKGFGPFIYELAMMLLDKEGQMLMPSRDGDVRGEAWGVWKKFYDRNGVKKKTLDLLDDDFRCDIITGDECYFEDNEDKQEWFNELSDDDKHALIVFNTGYSMTSNSDFVNLVNNSKKYSKEIVDKAQSLASDFWDVSY